MSIDYKQRAEECHRYSKGARSIAEKAVWLAIAENWLVLAKDDGETNLQKSQIVGFSGNDRANLLISAVSMPEASSRDDAQARKADRDGFAQMIELAGARASGSPRP